MEGTALRLEPLLEIACLRASDGLFAEDRSDAVQNCPRVEAGPTREVSLEAADRIGLLSGNPLDQERGEVFGFLEAGLAARIVGLLEELAKRHEPPEYRSVIVNPLKVLPEGRLHFGPAGPNDRRGLILLH